MRVLCSAKLQFLWHAPNHVQSLLKMTYSSALIPDEMGQNQVTLAAFDIRHVQAMLLCSAACTQAYALLAFQIIETAITHACQLGTST